MISPAGGMIRVTDGLIRVICHSVMDDNGFFVDRNYHFILCVKQGVDQ